MAYTTNPPPRPSTPKNAKDLYHQFNELYKNLYPLWQRTGEYNSIIPEQNINLTKKGNIGVSDSILLQYSIKAQGLTKYAQIEGFGNFAANANNKRIRLYAGSTILLDTGILAINSGSWVIKSEIFRVNINSQKSTSTIVSNNSTLNCKSYSVILNENLNNALLIKVIANGVADNDVTQEGLIVNLV